MKSATGVVALSPRWLFRQPTPLEVVCLFRTEGSQKQREHRKPEIYETSGHSSPPKPVGGFGSALFRRLFTASKRRGTHSPDVISNSSIRLQVNSPWHTSWRCSPIRVFLISWPVPNLRERPPPPLKTSGAAGGDSVKPETPPPPLSRPARWFLIRGFLQAPTKPLEWGGGGGSAQQQSVCCASVCLPVAGLRPRDHLP